MNASRLVRRAAAATTLLLGAAAAQAALQSYDFVVTLDPAGPSFSGSLAFDDAPAGATTGVFGELLFALSDFSFDFIDGDGAAKTYGLADLGFAEAVVEGATFAGINADELNGYFNFVSAVPAPPPSFAFDFAGARAGDGTGLVEYRLVSQPVSAPASLALVLAGLGLMVRARRRASLTAS